MEVPLNYVAAGGVISLIPLGALWGSSALRDLSEHLKPDVLGHWADRPITSIADLLRTEPWGYIVTRGVPYELADSDVTQQEPILEKAHDIRLLSGGYQVQCEIPRHPFAQRLMEEAVESQRLVTVGGTFYGAVWEKTARLDVQFMMTVVGGTPVWYDAIGRAHGCVTSEEAMRMSEEVKISPRSLAYLTNIA